jgi:hypothetical protein
LASSGSSPYVPEPVRIAFHSFSDIKNPETYAAPDENLLLQAGCKTSVDSKFNFTEWWKFAEGEKLSKPFDIGEELAAGLLRALEIVSALSYYGPSNRPGPQRLAGAELHAKTLNNFKEAMRQQQEIEMHMDKIALFLEEESQRCNEEADRLDSSHGM